MKKNTKKICVVLLLAIVAIASYFVSGTYAKYTRAVSGSDTVTVAKFSVDASGLNKEQNATIDLFDTVKEADLSAKEENVLAGKIAPGTGGEFTTTLKAKFNFIGVGEKTGYKITYKGYYVVLDLYTGNNLEDIVIDYSGFEPDTANSLMSSFTNGTTGTIESGDLEKNSHYELFFKKGTSTGTHNKTEIQRYTSKIKIGG